MFFQFQTTHEMDAITKDTEAAKPFTFKEFGDALLEFFSSLKLAIFLMITMAILATVGTVIQQGERPEVYIKEYGESAYWWFVKLGFIDIYHTWYFSTILVLLCINSLTCFHQRFPAIWRSIRQDKVNVTAQFIQNLKRSATVDLAAERGTVTEDIALAFAERGYRVLVNKGDAETTLYATKGIMGRIAAHVAHLSVTVIVIGGILGNVIGFRDFGVCLEGETYHIPQGNFDLHVDKFWIDYYDNGAVKSYNSTLTVIENGESKLTKTITVNDPLVYKGIWFYQSSYGDSWDRVEKARVVVRDKTTDKVVGEAILDWKKEAVLKDLGLKLLLTDFVADFGFDAKDRRVYSKTVEHENPAIKLAITEREQTLTSPWIFYNYPDLFDIQGSKYKFELTGYLAKKFTGLQIAKDPGVLLVWIGSTLLVVGVTLSAVIYHRRVWAKVVPGRQGVTVYVGGTAYKGQIDFDREFDRFTARLKARGNYTV
jgi:cytochrome c biogenesis protein